MWFDRHRLRGVSPRNDRPRGLLRRFRADLGYGRMISQLKNSLAIFFPLALDRNDLRACNLSYIIPRWSHIYIYAGLWNSAHGKHMVIRRFDSSRLGFVNGTDVLRNLCDARRVSATGGEQARAHLDTLSLNSMRAHELRISTCLHEPCILDAPD